MLLFLIDVMFCVRAAAAAAVSDREIKQKEKKKREITIYSFFRFEQKKKKYLIRYVICVSVLVYLLTNRRYFRREFINRKLCMENK